MGDGRVVREGRGDMFTLSDAVFCEFRVRYVTRFSAVCDIALSLDLLSAWVLLGYCLDDTSS
jgi:hypothetical protein